MDCLAQGLVFAPCHHIPILKDWQEPTMQEHHFQVPDMSCGGCVAQITRALKAQEPACQVHANVPEHSLQVSSERSREQVQTLLRQAGFEAA
jgi:copper chaperone